MEDIADANDAVDVGGPRVWMFEMKGRVSSKEIVISAKEHDKW